MREEILELFSAHYTKVVGFVMLACPATRETAEDAAQEAFIEAWQTAHRRPGQWEKVEHPLAWLRTVARRRHARPTGLSRTQPPITSGESWEHLLSAVDPSSGPADLAVPLTDLLSAIRALPNRDLRAVMAFTLDGFPDNVIAAQLDMDDQQIRNLRAKARQQLARTLGPAYRRNKEGEGSR